MAQGAGQPDHGYRPGLRDDDLQDQGSRRGGQGLRREAQTELRQGWLIKPYVEGRGGASPPDAKAGSCAALLPLVPRSISSLMPLPEPQEPQGDRAIRWLSARSSRHTRAASFRVAREAAILGRGQR